MERREFFKSAGGLALAPALSLARTHTDTDGRLTPEQYKRRVPTHLGEELKIEHSETELPSGTHITSSYQRQHPLLRIIYSEGADEQVLAQAGELIYGPDSITDACRFLQLFDRHVQFDFQMATGSGYSYYEYSIENWSAVVQEDLSVGSSSSVAIIDGERIKFGDRGEKRETVRDEVVERIFP